MSLNTVAEFAKELHKSPQDLLEQLRAAGVAKKSASDALSDSDKQQLLAHLKNTSGVGDGERKKITLTKRSTSEIKQAAPFRWRCARSARLSSAKTLPR